MEFVSRIAKIIGTRSWEKYRLVFLLICVSAIVETISVAAILPYMNAVTGGTGIEWLGMANLSPAGLALVFVSLYCLGILLRSISIFYTTKTTMREGYAVGSNLFQSYLGQPYEWHTLKNSSDTFSLILNDAQDFISFVLIPIGRLFSQLVLTLLLVIVLLVVQPITTLVTACVLIVAYVSTYTLLRKRLKSNGEIQLECYRLRQRTCSEALGAIRETKLSKLEEKFASEFHQTSVFLGLTSSRLAIQKEIPRLVLEACLIGFLIFYGLMFSYGQGFDSHTAAPNIAILAVAGLKLFPMGHLIFSNFATLRSSLPLVEKIEKAQSEYESPDALKPLPLLQHEIRLENISYRYPAGDQYALKDVSLTIGVGQKIAITGPSGAGKSTLIDLISGLIQPTNGAVYVDGAPLTKNTSLAWQDQLQFCPQAPFLFDVSLGENIALSEDYDLQDVEAAAKLAGIHSFIGQNFPDAYEALAGERGQRLSGGQIQRVSIARTVYKDVPVYIFDEPTSNLDPEIAYKILDQIFESKENAVLVIVTHDPAVTAKCDQIINL